MLKGAGDLHDEEARRQRRLDASREEACHAEDDEGRAERRGQSAERNCRRREERTRKRTEDEDGQKDAARHARAVAEDREEELAEEDDEDRAEDERLLHHAVDEKVAARKDLRQQEAENARREERNRCAKDEGRHEAPPSVEREAEHAVEEPAERTREYAEQEEQQIRAAERHGGHGADGEHRTDAKDLLRHEARGDGRSEDAHEHLRREVLRQLFEGKDEARQRRVEDGGEACASTRRQKESLLGARTPGRTADARTHAGADLHARAAAPERQSRADAEHDAGELAEEHARPAQVTVAAQDALEVGDAAAADHGVELHETTDDDGKCKEREKTPRRPERRSVAQEVVEHGAQMIGAFQEPVIERDDSAHEDADQKPVGEEAQAKERGLFHIEKRTLDIFRHRIFPSQTKSRAASKDARLLTLLKTARLWALRHAKPKANTVRACHFLPERRSGCGKFA